MNSHKVRAVCFSILRYFFGILLLTTAAGKLLDNRGFAAVIETYQVGIKGEDALVVGLLFSLFELWLGSQILFNRRQARNSILTIVLHVAYLTSALVTLTRGLELHNCGCFGVFWQRPMNRITVAEDLILLTLAVLFFLLVRGREGSKGSNQS